METIPALRSQRTIAAISMVAILSGCGNPPDNPESRVTTYMDRDLECVAYASTNAHTGYDCDFAGFHADPQFKAPSEMPRIEDGKLTEQTFTYKGGELHCLTFATDNAHTEGRTCDYTRFHNEYPPAK